MQTVRQAIANAIATERGESENQKVKVKTERVKLKIIHSGEKVRQADLLQMPSPLERMTMEINIVKIKIRRRRRRLKK